MTVRPTERDRISYGLGYKSDVEFHGEVHFPEFYSNVVDIPTLTKPTLNDFLRHYNHYGPTMLLEIAEAYLPTSEFVQLMIRIKESTKPLFRKKQEFQLTRKQVAKGVTQLTKDGVAPQRIAKLLGVSPSTVYRIRRGGENG